jgi:hypothetical protein
VVDDCLRAELVGRETEQFIRAAAEEALALEWLKEPALQPQAVQSQEKR